MEAEDGAAKSGVLSLARGSVQTPVFMPVGTAGSVKSLSPRELRDVGAEMVLANAYHLSLRPGTEVLSEFGGLHRFMSWGGPILTDSGGYQVFSLARIREIDDFGVTFRSHLDGSKHRLTPERSIDIQAAADADIRMAFDECVKASASRSEVRVAVDRSHAWLLRCADHHDQLEARRSGGPRHLFPIVQGATFPDLRLESVERTFESRSWPGVGIGGLAVGEEREAMYEVLDQMDELLPREIPRYLMGVGYPEDMLEAIRRGVDMFDCVAPTRNGRNGTAFTRHGTINIKGARFARDQNPLDSSCACYCCTHFSRAYLRHLFISRELLGLRLMSLHNVSFLLQLTSHARAAVLRNDYDRWANEWLADYRQGDGE